MADPAPTGPSFGPSWTVSGSLAAAVEETHISVLLLAGDRAYKLKKAIELPFLDWRDREVRRQVCEQEVELNRRLAPDVYLGVADVLGPEGTPCDHLVVMRRMPDDRRLRRLVREGADVRPELTALAVLLARFHRDAVRPAAAEELAGIDSVLGNWEDNLAVLHAHTATILDADLVDLVDERAHRYLAGRRALFDARRAAGAVVDGHGDLLADDIYLLDDGPRVLDCLEFSERFRTVDVLDDVAFLAMDLERLGAPSLAAHFVAAYVAESGTEQPTSLLHHFVAYRAGVRAKVACLRAVQGGLGAEADARQHLDLLARHLDAGRVRLVLVGGLPGTGKTSVAFAVGKHYGWPVLRSDVVRKELAGVSPTTGMASPYRSGIYDARHTAATYEAMLDQARMHLVLGQSVVLDASWTDPVWRDAALDLARGTSSDVVALRCTAPTDVAAARLAARRGDASDADASIAAAMATDESPWPGATVVVNAGDLEDALRAAVAATGAAGVVPAAIASKLR